MQYWWFHNVAIASGTSAELDAFDAEMADDVEAWHAKGLQVEAVNHDRRGTRTRWEFDTYQVPVPPWSLIALPGLTVHWLARSDEGWRMRTILGQGKTLGGDEFPPEDADPYDGHVLEVWQQQAGWPAGARLGT
jgi:hypothetical protein